MEKLIILIALLGVVMSKTPKYLPCGGSGKINVLDIVPCDDPNTCVFTRGAKATITVDFTPSTAHENVIAAVTGDVYGVKVPFPLGTCGDACKCGVQCPSLPNKQYNFTTTLDVKTIYPPIPVVVELRLQDAQSKADIVCFKVSVQLK